MPDAAARLTKQCRKWLHPSAWVKLLSRAVVRRMIDVVTGEDAFNIVDYRTGALGVEDAAAADGSLWVRCSSASPMPRPVPRPGSPPARSC